MAFNPADFKISYRKYTDTRHENKIHRFLSVTAHNRSPVTIKQATISFLYANGEVVTSKWQRTVSDILPNEQRVLATEQYVHASNSMGTLRTTAITVRTGDGSEYNIDVPEKLRAGIKGGCFVATACFGDENHPTVERLRQFRDEKLQNSAIGRAFIAAYNEVGPRAADLIERAPYMKAPLRKVLTAISRLVPVGRASKPKLGS